MARIEVPQVPEGYNSWEEYYNKIKNDLKAFEKEHPNAKNYGDPFYREHRDLAYKVDMTKYKVDDEKKLAKKAALEAQAAEAGIGPKEMKVVNTMDRLLKSFENWKAKAEKAISKGTLSENIYNKALEYANLSIKAVDDAWENIKDSNNDRGSFIRKNLYIVSGNEYGYNYRDFIPWDSNYELSNISPDIENLISSYTESLYKRAEARVADNRISSRAKSKEDKEARYQSIRRTFYGPIETGKVPTMKLFLDNWKEDYVNYFTDSENVNKYRLEYEDASKKYNEFINRDEYKNNHWKRGGSTPEERKYVSELNEKAEILRSLKAEAWQYYYPFTRSKEDIVKDSEHEADYMERKFISAVYDYSKEIKEVNLKIGKGGNLNGVVTGMDGKKWRVETIIASGPIQRAHLRTLVHEIK